MKRKIKKSHDLPQSRDSPMRLGELCGEIEYKGNRAIERRRGSSGNVRLPHRLVSVFCLFVM